MTSRDDTPLAGKMVPVTVIRASAAGLESRSDLLAAEEPLEIRVNYASGAGPRVTRAVSVTMRTPGHDAELAVGFLFGEGLIRGANQVFAVSLSENRAEVELAEGVAVNLASLERHFFTTSSCGVCGKTSIAAVTIPVPVEVSPGELEISLELILSLPLRLRQAQSVFDGTGGLHGAGLFAANGTLVASREDVGRHNAVDKVIGSRVLAGQVPLRQSILVLSGRASFELLQKAIVAGIPVVVAVGAPSSLAVDLARRHGTTLIGFVREGRMNVYAGAHRLREAKDG